MCFAGTIQFSDQPSLEDATLPILYVGQLRPNIVMSFVQSDTANWWLTWLECRDVIKLFCFLFVFYFFISFLLLFLQLTGARTPKTTGTWYFFF